MHVKRGSFTGERNDHYRPRKTRPTPQTWLRMVTKEYAAAPKVEIDGVLCGVRVTGQPWLPFQLLKPRGESFTILDVWQQDDGPLHVREQMSKEVLAVLRLTEDGTLEQIPRAEEAAVSPGSPYNEVEEKFRHIESLLSEPLPPVVRQETIAARRSVQRQMSALSLQEVYADGQKALLDGIGDDPLYSAALKIQSLERQLLKGTLSPDEQKQIVENLLPNSRQAFLRRVMYLRRQGQI